MAYDRDQWTANEAASTLRRRWVPWLLGAAMLIAPALAVLEILDDGVEPETFANIIPIALLLALALINSPFATDTLLASKPRPKDEFERAAIGRATQRAYSILTGLMLAAFAWLWFAALYDWPTPVTPLDWSSWGIAFVTIAVALPVFLAELAVPLSLHHAEEDEA